MNQQADLDQCTKMGMKVKGDVVGGSQRSG